MNKAIAAGALLAATMLAGAAMAQNLAGIEVTHTGTTWQIHNLTQKAITAFVIRTGYGPLHVTPTNINCAPAEIEEEPLAPGAVRYIPVKPDRTPVEVPAVIFADGSVSGTAVSVEGIDVVEQIFLFRRGEANEYTRWLQILDQPDHHTAIESFRRELEKPRKQPSGMEESGRAGAVQSITGQLATSQGSEEQIYQRLLTTLRDRVAFTRQSSTRRAQ